MPQIIIAVTGFYQSGKDTMADYLVKNGFFHVSLSDILREECRKRKRYHGRDDLIAVGNELRLKYGNGVLAKMALKKAKNKEKIVISSVRNVGEVKELKKENKFFLVAIDVPIKIRFSRAKKRGKIDDKVSFKKFKEQENLERKGKGHKQQLDKVNSLADYRIINSSTLKYFYQKIEEFLKQVLIKEKKIVLVGRPASGKGTQAELLAKNFSFPLISSGNLFRQCRRKRTELGKKIKGIIDEGRLIPDEITNEIVFKEIKKQKKGFVLDGYPRTFNQATKLSKVTDLDVVFEIFISEKEVLERLSNRRVCQCGATYNLISKLPQKKNTCDSCGGKLFQRGDDKPVAIKQRLAVFSRQTMPVIKYYRQKGILIKINGKQSIEDVFKDVLKNIK